jgi:superfamily I DNA/RNA helicase
VRIAPREAADLGQDEAKIAVMHLAKGLEFRAVVVMACDQDVLPLAGRIAEAADEGELDDIYETERQLLYVSCTRARERLLVAGVAPGSEFLKDL